MPRVRMRAVGEHSSLSVVSQAHYSEFAAEWLQMVGATGHGSHVHAQSHQLDMTADRSRLLLAAVAIAAASCSASLAPGARAFAVAGSQDAALTARCTQGYNVVNRACGKAPAGQYVPSQCTAWCQLVYVSWWPKCQGVREYAMFEASTGHALSGFYRTCQAAARPTCRPCPGSAKASDVLPVDERVLSSGSPQAAAFCVTWTGQIANLLCVSASQVAVTAIARAAAAGGGSSGHRRLSEVTVGAKVSVQVTWSLAAGSTAQALSLVQNGQLAMGWPAMGRRQLKRKNSSCVVGNNDVGSLIKTSRAVASPYACADKADSGFAGLACLAAIAQFKHGCAGSAMSATQGAWVGPTLRTPATRCTRSTTRWTPRERGVSPSPAPAPLSRVIIESDQKQSARAPLPPLTILKCSSRFRDSCGPRVPLHRRGQWRWHTMTPHIL